MMAANTSSLSKTRRVVNSHPGALLDDLNYALVEVDECNVFDDSYYGERLWAYDDLDQLIVDETAANKMNDSFNDIHSHSSNKNINHINNNKLTSFAAPAMFTRHMPRTNMNDPYSGYNLTDPDLSYLPHNASAGGWMPRGDKSLLARQFYGHATPATTSPAAVSPEPVLSRSSELFQGPSFHPVPGIDETIPMDLSRAMSGDTLFFDPLFRSLPVATCTDADATEDEDEEDRPFLPMSIPRSIAVGTSTAPSRVSYSNLAPRYAGVFNLSNNDTTPPRIPPSARVDHDTVGATTNTAPAQVEAPAPKKRTMDKISPVGAKNDAPRTRTDSPLVTTTKLPHWHTKKRRTSRSTRDASSDLNTGVATTSDKTNSTTTSTAAETDVEYQTNIVDSGMQVSNPNMGREVRPVRFRLYHAEQWSEKLNDLKDFVSEYGHAMVPHNYAPDPELARWAKRQRYQYKLYEQPGPAITRQKQSSLTPQRIQALNTVGFCWDAHVAIWTERYEELKDYKQRYGNANVPSNYKGDSQQRLATWVKCQRRQYKLCRAGDAHNITDDRIALLEQIGFEWSLANPCKKAAAQGGGEANDNKEEHTPLHPLPVAYQSSGSFN